MKNILLPYDLSSHSDLAFEKALDLAAKLNSKLHILSVIGPEINTSGMSLSRAEEALEEYENKIRSGLENLKESAKKKNITISTNTINDPSPSSGILRFANSNKIDLIIIGSHGRTGITKAVLGSVASGVLKDANCPVMIVKMPKSDKKNKQ